MRKVSSDPDETKSTGVGWHQPPKSRHGYDWDIIAAELKARPGQWKLIFEGGRTSVANGIRNGNVRQLRPAEGFEVTTRNNRVATDDGPKTCDMYLRWVEVKQL